MNQRLLRRVCDACSGKGCAECVQTGYRGRLPVVEFLRVNDTLRRHLAARELDSLAATPSLADRARELVKSGTTNEPEVSRILGSPCEPV